MSQVVSFENYRPPPRYDEVPWTAARVQEAPTKAGAWSTIDEIALDPPDIDPSEPQLRSFSTHQASDEPGLWYRVVFVDGSGDTSQPTTPVQNLAPGDLLRDLCTITDVLRYVPGYEPEDETNDVLQALITAESRSIHLECDREFIAIPGADPRLFLVDDYAVRTGIVRIGDATEVTAVELQEETGDLVVELGDEYKLLPLLRQEWEPIRALQVLRSSDTFVRLRNNRYLQVTGTWGFPALPQNVREACAKRVIVRYLTDVTFRGSAFSDALAESPINIAGLLRSSLDALGQFCDPVVA